MISVYLLLDCAKGTQTYVKTRKGDMKGNSFHLVL